jgi:vacuolar-type H+-ATPase subunit F/Vma7
MSASVAVLCRESVATGFALAGVVAEAVVDTPDASACLETLLGREDVGVVLVEDDLWAGLTADVRRRAERGTRPVVVPFPSPGRPAGVPAHDHIIEILRRAIGYRVHL